MRPDGNGGFQFANLGTNGTGTNANSQQGFAFLSTLGVIVQAIGIGHHWIVKILSHLTLTVMF